MNLTKKAIIMILTQLERNDLKTMTTATSNITQKQIFEHNRQLLSNPKNFTNLKLCLPMITLNIHYGLTRHTLAWILAANDIDLTTFWPANPQQHLSYDVYPTNNGLKATRQAEIELDQTNKLKQGVRAEMSQLMTFCQSTTFSIVNN